MSSAWDGDWRRRIENRVAEAGYDSVWHFSASHSARTFKELSQILGPQVAAVQLEKILRDEASCSADSMKVFAQSCLVREIRHYLPNGWGISEELNFHRASTFARWANRLGSGEYDDLVRRVWRRLVQAHAPDNWIPEGPNDPIIRKIFDGIEFPV